MTKNYNLYPKWERKIDNWRRRIEGYEKNKRDLKRQIQILKRKNKKQKEVIDKAIKKINDYKIYCKENKGFTEYTDIEIEAIETILIKMEDILKEVSE